MPTERDARIVAAALARFTRSGYERTTLGDIARAAGLTEVEMHDSFVTKDALVAELTGPLLVRLDALVRSAGDADSRDPDEVAGVLGAYLSVLVDHRKEVEVLLGDPTAAACPAVSRLQAGLTELRNELAGPAGGLDERIRASSALGAVHQAVADSTDAELLTTRAVVIGAAMAILDDGYRR